MPAVGPSDLQAAAIIALTGLAACGPSLGERVEDARTLTCGRDGPTRLLPLVLAERVDRAGDRLVVRGHPLVDGAPSDTPELWAVGPCGEDPVRLLQGDRDLRVVGDLLLACADDGRVDRLDPSGRRPPSPLFPRASCAFEAVDAGLLAHDPERREILLHPSPHDDDLAPIVVATDVADPSSHTPALQTDGTSAFVLDGRSRVQRVDLQTLTSTIIAQDIEEFMVLPEDRLLVEDRELGQGSRRVRLLELGAGRSQPLDALGLAWLLVRWPLAMGVAVDEADEDELGVGTFDLRTGARLDVAVPTGLSFYWGLWGLDGSYLIMSAPGGSTPGEDVTYYVWSEARTEWRPLARFESWSTARQAHDRFEVATATDLAAAQDAIDLWLVELRGGEPTLAARDIDGLWLTRPRHVVWSRFEATGSLRDGFGDLLVVELYGDDRQRLDEHAQLLTHPTMPDLDGDVLYSVLDGERSGLWRSALP